MTFKGKGQDHNANWILEMKSGAAVWTSFGYCQIINHKETYKPIH